MKLIVRKDIEEYIKHYRDGVDSHPGWVKVMKQYAGRDIKVSEIGISKWKKGEVVGSSNNQTTFAWHPSWLVEDNPYLTGKEL
jgi:hypothetical protein